jgi:hypothetical protein
VTRSPAYIRALLDVHTLPQPDVSLSLLSELANDELIERVSASWRTTKRGEAYAILLAEVPLPEQRWVDPRKGKA